MCRRAALRHALDGVWRELPPYRRRAHSAGVLDDGVMKKKEEKQPSWERLSARGCVRKCWRGSRVSRACQLASSTSTSKVDIYIDIYLWTGARFFLLYSSASSPYGTPGQANHACRERISSCFAWYLRGQACHFSPSIGRLGGDLGGGARDVRRALNTCSIVGMIARLRIGPDERSSAAQYQLLWSAAELAQPLDAKPISPHVHRSSLKLLHSAAARPAAHAANAFHTLMRLTRWPLTHCSG